MPLQSTHLHQSIVPITSDDGLTTEWLASIDGWPVGLFGDELRARLAADNWATALRLGIVSPAQLAEPPVVLDPGPEGPDTPRPGDGSDFDGRSCACRPLCAACRGVAARMLYR